MSVYSMTGYASVQRTPGNDASTAAAGPRLGLEIRSVNSRFLDLVFRLPEELRHVEPALRERLTATLKRGKVEVRVAVETSTATVLRDPPPATLQRLSAIQDTVKAWLPNAVPLSVADVIRLSTSDNIPTRDLSADLTELMQQALDALLDARAREGKRLVEMLLERTKSLRALAAQATPLVPQLVEQQRNRFLERWNETLALVGGTGKGGVSPEAAQDRALAEATAFAIRIDVAEEITRLDSHLDEIDRLLKKGGEAGKRLDFLIQELHREANTLGSKSAAMELTRISVDMKVLIEQMREQVQNIE
jgi:uncharacterized protein (TIGR00255 family)